MTGATGGPTRPTGGKRAGSRRGPRRRPRLQPAVLLLAAGVTAAVVAWGYLVYAAIDFGTTARGGDSRAWAFLALASLGAVACLFVALMLIARLARHLGLTSAPPPPSRPSRASRTDDSEKPAATDPAGPGGHPRRDARHSSSDAGR